MSFNVKNYHSHTSWRIGKGGFGDVYSGYQYSPSSIDENSVVRQFLGDDSCFCTLPPGCASSGCRVLINVAIKLERVDAERQFLPKEAKVLKALQGGEGIPEFHLFSHTSLPSSHQRPQLSNSSPGTPRVMQFKRLPSPLSTPAITPRHSPVLLEQPLPADFPDSLPSYAPLYNALVLERLGKDLQSTFNQYQCGDDTAVPFTGTPTPTELSLTLEAKTVPRSRPNSPVVEIMPLSHPQGTDPLKRRSRKPLAIKLTSHFREKRQPSKHRVWTVTTIVNIGCQMLRRLEYMHGKGYVHRDLKPDNFCVGLGPKSDTLYIIDFGMSQSYLTPEGDHIPDLERLKGCVGTQAFMSHRCGRARRDDVEGLAYVLLYLYKGCLPWSHDAMKFEQSFAKSGAQWTHESAALNAHIQATKRQLLQNSDGLEDVPRELRAIFTHVAGLPFTATPDYRLMRGLLRALQHRITGLKTTISNKDM